MQISFFDGESKFKVTKPLRLIELFAGYGSQALALKYLGIPFEHHAICEWAVNSIQAYKDLHHGEDNTDYYANLSDNEIVDYLDGRISSDYSTPLTREQIMRKGEAWRRNVYNNMRASKNHGSICKVTAKDLNIVDGDKYAYMWTYSFPCQDLSLAGKGASMAKGSGTRSSMLWEVERLLDECETLPDILFMENVPEVIGSKNIKHFAEWLAKLESLGYKNKWQVSNAKDFGIAQNRNRCYMVSVQGNYFYNPPQGFKLEYRLKHFLDKSVDEKYYLSEDTIKALNIHKERHDAVGNGFGWKPTDGGGTATTITTESGYRPSSNFIIEQTRETNRQDNGHGKHIDGERLQGVWESSNERRDGTIPPTQEIGECNGICFHRGKEFQCGEMKGLSRTIDTQAKNGVVIWKK